MKSWETRVQEYEDKGGISRSDAQAIVDAEDLQTGKDMHNAFYGKGKTMNQTKHTKGPRCTNCTWIHEADSTAGTSFMGVGLCALHAAAPELLEACKRIMSDVDNGKAKIQPATGISISSAIAKATQG